MRLLRRFGMLGVLALCFYVAGDATSVSGLYDGYQHPHPNCPPGVACVPPNTQCGCGISDVIEGTCSDVWDLNTCAFSCQRYEGNACLRSSPSNCANAEMPFCDQGMAYCNGSTWVCDDAGTNTLNSCSSQPVPSCSGGAYCYNGTWYCANNQGCSGSAPTCIDPTDVTGTNRIPAVCHSGIWVCGAP